MGKLDQNLNNMFDIKTESENGRVPSVRNQHEQDLTTPEDLKAQEDKEHARITIKNIMSKGDVVLDELITVATDSDHPRAYEVVATLMRTLVDASEKLTTLHKNDNPTKKDNTSVNVDKAIIFEGKPADLLKQLKNKDV